MRRTRECSSPPSSSPTDSVLTWTKVIYLLHAFSLITGILTLGLAILIAWLLLGIITVWFIYRIIRGLVALTERRPTYA